MNISSKMLITLISAALVSLSVNAPARADQGTSLVRHDDLDLSRPADLRVLQKRMDQAANALCLNPTGPAPAATVDAACKSDAVRAARAQLEELTFRSQLAAAPTGPTLGSAD